MSPNAKVSGRRYAQSHQAERFFDRRQCAPSDCSAGAHPIAVVAAGAALTRTEAVAAVKRLLTGFCSLLVLASECPPYPAQLAKDLLLHSRKPVVQFVELLRRHLGSKLEEGPPGEGRGGFDLEELFGAAFALQPCERNQAVRSKDQGQAVPVVTTRAKRKIFGAEAPCLGFRGHRAVRPEIWNVPLAFRRKITPSTPVWPPRGTSIRGR